MRQFPSCLPGGSRSQGPSAYESELSRGPGGGVPSCLPGGSRSQGPSAYESELSGGPGREGGVLSSWRERESGAQCLWKWVNIEGSGLERAAEREELMSSHVDLMRGTVGLGGRGRDHLVFSGKRSDWVYHVITSKGMGDHTGWQRVMSRMSSSLFIYNTSMLCFKGEADCTLAYDEQNMI